MGMLIGEGVAMELAGEQGNLLDDYLETFGPLLGDRRTEIRDALATVRGIVGAERLVCARIAAFPP